MNKIKAGMIFEDGDGSVVEVLTISDEFVYFHYLDEKDFIMDLEKREFIANYTEI